MKILVINSGSSSIKYRLFDMVDKSVLATGLIEQIGETGSRLTHQSRGKQGDRQEINMTQPIENHQSGFQLIERVLQKTGVRSDTGELSGIGHRVVHGGEKFRLPTIINSEVIEAIRRLIPLAPLHNPAHNEKPHWRLPGMYLKSPFLIQLSISQFHLTPFVMRCLKTCMPTMAFAAMVSTARLTFMSPNRLPPI